MLGRMAGLRSMRRQREQRWPNLQKAWTARRRKAAQRREARGVPAPDQRPKTSPLSGCDYAKDATRRQQGFYMPPGVFIHPGGAAIVDTRFSGMSWREARVRGLKI